MQKLLIVLRRAGPYHHARFKAALRDISIIVLETRPDSKEYPWEDESKEDYLIKLQGASNEDSDPKIDLIDSQIHKIIDLYKPTVVLSVGWADRTYQALLSICQFKRIPIIIVSDSREIDEKRFLIKEWLKKQLLKGYSAALVAGKESEEYIKKLGFPSFLIRSPWDVVDNKLFERSFYVKPNYLEPHFLSVSRFVSKKNIEGLLEAYNKYQKEGGKWGLTLIGSGPEEKKIKSISKTLQNPSIFKIIPFQQINQLAYSYSQASAFVLASTCDQWGLVVNEAMASGLPCIVSKSCGCTVDLIEHGKSGWSFNPLRTSELVSLLFEAENQTEEQKQEMILAAKEKLNSFNLDSFAISLKECMQKALLVNRRSFLAQFTAQLLSLRPWTF